MTELEYSNSVTKYENRVFAFIFSKTKDEELAKDVTQDAFMKLWINKATVKIESTKSWLFTTAYNHMINLLKFNNRFVDNTILEEKESVVDVLDTFDVKEIVMRELKKLNQQEQRLIILRDVHNFTYNEIGERMGLTETQVKVYLFRARKKIKDKLKGLVQ